MADIKGIIVSGIIPKFANATTYEDAEALIKYNAHQITLDGDVKSHGQLWCADLNSDFEIDIKDVWIITGQTTPTYYVAPTLLGDVNCDSVFDEDDVILLGQCLDYVSKYDPEHPGSSECWEALLIGRSFEYEGETITAPEVTQQGLVNARYADGDKAHGVYDTPWFDSVNSNLYDSANPAENSHYLAMLTVFDNMYGVTIKPTYTGIAGNDITLTIDVSDEYVTKCDYKWYCKSPEDISPVPIENSNTNRLVVTNMTTAMSGSRYIVEVWDRTEAEPQSRFYPTTLYVYSETDTLWGDVNGDGIVNILDIAKFEGLFNHRMGDVNLDGVTDANDASADLAYYAKQSTGLEDAMVYDEVYTAQGVIDAVNKYGLDMTKDLIQTLADTSGDGLIDSVDASEILDAYAKASVGEDNPLPILADTDRGITVRSENNARALVMLPNETSRSTALKQAHIDRIMESIKNNNVHLS